MSAKHTPGPWRLEADPAHFDSLTTVTGGQRMNAKPHAWPAYPLTVQVGGTATLNEMQATARLIAAAPELLEVAQAARARIALECDVFVDCNAYPDGSLLQADKAILDGMNKLLARMDAAIAKATAHKEGQ